MSPLSRALSGVLLILVVCALGGALYYLKNGKDAAAAALAAQQPEWADSIESAVARTVPHARSTTAIGTVRALQSINLQNELAGTVRQVHLNAGDVVDAGTLLVELDVAVETAELAALEAEAKLAASLLARTEQAEKDQGASAADVDRARAERDKAMANVARTKAVIEQKRVRAPFRARVGMVDLHPGQYLVPGTVITTLQGVDEAVHIDFSVTQEAAATLAVGGDLQVTIGDRVANAKIVAIDARVESATRNMWVRALLKGAQPLPAPGASVRVRVPVEALHDVVVVPVSALRRGPGGDYVFALEAGPDGSLRSKTRRVTTGAVLGDDIVIASGLATGDRVAAVGSFKLHENGLVIDKSQPSKQ